MAHFAITSDLASGTVTGATTVSDQVANATDKQTPSAEGNSIQTEPILNLSSSSTSENPASGYASVSVLAGPPWSPDSTDLLLDVSSSSYDGSASASLTATITIEPDGQEAAGTPVIVNIHGNKQVGDAPMQELLTADDLDITPFGGPGVYLAHVGDSIEINLSAASSGAGEQYLGKYVFLELNAPDVSVSSFRADSDSGANFQYSTWFLQEDSLSPADLQSLALGRSATIGAYWSSTAEWSGVLGDSIYTVQSEAAPGWHTAHIPQSVLDSPPSSANYLLIVANPDGSFAESDAPTYEDNVAALPLTSISVVSSQNEAVYGQAIDLTATVTAATVPSEGTVTFFEGDKMLGTGVVNGGTATLKQVLLHAGVHIITASYSDGFGEYAPSVTNAQAAPIVTISPAPLTITADDQSKVYGADLPTLTESYSGFVNGDTRAVVITPPTLSTTAMAGSHVSGNPYSITASGADAGDDYSIGYVAGTLTITPAPLTIAADDKSMVQGTALPELTASYSALVNGDTAASLAMQPILSTSANTASPTGSYPITVGGAADSDYTITYVPGTLTISDATTALTLTIGLDASLTQAAYGNAITLTAGVTSGQAPSVGTVAFLDGTKILGTADMRDGQATLDKVMLHTGLHGITISYHDPSDSYGDVEPIEPVVLTITPATLTVTAEDKTKIYAAAMPELTAKITGFVNGDTAAVVSTAPTLSTTAIAASHVSGGPYTIKASGADAGADYSIIYVDGELSVTPATLTITADDKSMVQGANPPVLTATYEGLVNGDTPASVITQPTLSTVASTTSPEGSYSIAVEGAADPDYIITQVPGTLAVTVSGTPDERYVKAVYHDVLGREPDSGGLAYWANLIDGGAPIFSVAQAIAHSDEYYATFVIQPAYQALLDRSADEAGLKFWTQAMHQGLTQQQLQARFIAADEFYASAGADDAKWIDSVYQHLLGRAADAEGANYWINQLGQRQTRQQVAGQIAGSTENNAQIINADYFHYLGRGPDSTGLDFWLHQFDQGKTNEDLIAGFTGSDEYYARQTA